MHTKLFAGTRLTPDLKMQLGDNLAPLSCIIHEGKEFIGFYLESFQPSVQEVRHHCDRLLLTLQELLPQMRVDNLPVLVFPQLFVG